MTIAEGAFDAWDQSEGVLAGIRQACDTHGVSLGELDLILHGLDGRHEHDP